MAKKKKRTESELETDKKKKKKKTKRKEEENEKDFESQNHVVNGDSHDEVEEEVKKDEKKRKKKKKKREKGNDNKNEDGNDGGVAKFREVPTVSIAIPGSIIDNAQSLELATRLSGQIARAATIFRIDEVVVFDNKSSLGNVLVDPMTENSDENESGAAFLVRILQYLETPQYLRKALFPKHNSLRFVGMLPPLDAPHHLRKHEWAPYREGVTLKQRAPNSSGMLVDVGLNKNVIVDQVLEAGTRVTVTMGTDRNLNAELPHQVVAPSKPREAGLYWGYKVRYASNISSVFKDCPYKGGYDYLIGTSEHGLTIRSMELEIPTFRHLLIAFGGLAGLEECVEEDSNLKGKNVRQVFHKYLNTCPHQGSRTIRTEEAIFISLQYFQEPIARALQNIGLQS